MSSINLLVFESIFRVRNDVNKYKPSVLAYLAVHGEMPPKNTVYNGAVKNKMFGNKLYDYNLEPDWINNLNDSEFIDGEFRVSGGSDKNNVSFISFDKSLSSSDKNKLNKLKTSVPHTYIEIDKHHFMIPKVVISSPYYYDKDSINDNREWREWWDNITLALKDM